MTALILFISFSAGTILAEIASRIFGKLWFSNHCRQINALLGAYREADGDDARQLSLLRAGIGALQFSLGLLWRLMVLSVIAGLPLWMLECTESQMAVYFAVLSAVAAGWWMLRYQLRSSVPPSGSRSAPCSSEDAQ